MLCIKKFMKWIVVQLRNWCLHSSSWLGFIARLGKHGWNLPSHMAPSYNKIRESWLENEVFYEVTIGFVLSCIKSLTLWWAFLTVYICFLFFCFITLIILLWVCNCQEVKKLLSLKIKKAWLRNEAIIRIRIILSSYIKITFQTILKFYELLTVKN